MVSQIVAFGQYSKEEEIKVIPKYVRVREPTVEPCSVQCVCSVQPRTRLYSSANLFFAREPHGLYAPLDCRARAYFRHTSDSFHGGKLQGRTCIATRGRGTSVLNSAR